jgi:hypothetical protein
VGAMRFSTWPTRLISPKRLKLTNFSTIWTSGNTSLDVAYLLRALVLHAVGNKEELELAAFGILHPELGVRFVENWCPFQSKLCLR